MYNKKFENFINDITFQTCLMYGIKDSSEMLDFRDTLESNVIEEIIRCKDVIKVTQTNYKHGSNDVSSFIKSAIIESGLDKYGMIPAKALYKIDPLVNDENLGVYAVSRYRDIEKELYGEDYPSTALRIAENCLRHEVLDIEETLKFAFYVGDRTSMLIFEPGTLEIKQALKMAWSIEKGALEKRGYKESLCYKICDEVISSDKRYDLSQRNALLAIAMADYRLNAGIEVTSTELDYINKRVDIAKVEHPEIEKYKEEFYNRINTDTTVIKYIKRK